MTDVCMSESLLVHVHLVCQRNQLFPGCSFPRLCWEKLFHFICITGKMKNCWETDRNVNITGKHILHPKLLHNPYASHRRKKNPVLALFYLIQTDLSFVKLAILQIEIDDHCFTPQCHVYKRTGNKLQYYPVSCAEKPRLHILPSSTVSSCSFWRPIPF